MGELVREDVWMKVECRLNDCVEGTRERSEPVRCVDKRGGKGEGGAAWHTERRRMGRASGWIY